MKVRLFNTAALAAATLATQGIAQQQEDSLERALSDLNTGLAAQEDANNGPIWGGYFRARNVWHDNGVETNNVDIDVVATINMLFNVNEDARIFAEINDSTTFGDPSSGNPVPSGMTSSYDNRANGAFDVPRFYAEVDSLVGLGGRAKIGRDEYTVGTGRILGSDDWDNVPQTHNGMWYSNELVEDFMSLQTSITNDIDTGNIDESDARLWVLATPMSLDVGGGMGVTPYYIRYDGFAGMPGGLLPGGDSGTWFGVDLNGEILGFDWDIEFADFSTGPMGGTAFAIDLAYALSALESLPFIDSGELEFKFSSSDEEFSPIAPSYHNTGGYSDRMGRGGQWAPGTDMFGLGLGLAPAEGWGGELAFYSVEQTVGMSTDEWTEIDLGFTTELGGGVDAFFGIASVSPDVGDSEFFFWTLLELSFGSEVEADA